MKTLGAKRIKCLRFFRFTLSMNLNVMNEIEIKKKLINWAMLIALLVIILFAVRWAGNKRDAWLKAHKTEMKK